MEGVECPIRSDDSCSNICKGHCIRCVDVGKEISSQLPFGGHLTELMKVHSLALVSIY